MRIGGKLILSFLVVVLVPMGILFFYSTSAIKSTAAESTEKAITENLEAAWIQYYVRGDQMRFGMLQAAAEPEVKRAVAERDREYLKGLMIAWKEYRPYVDIWLVVDENGRVISRLSSSSFGDVVSLNGAVGKAIETGDAHITTEIVSEELLSKEGFSRTDGMLLSVVTPVFMDGKATGAIITTDLLNEDDFIPSALAARIPGLLVSVVQGDILITTNMEQDGNNLVGSILAEDIATKIKAGESFEKDAHIGAGEYKIAVEPIRNNKNEVIGALFVGVPTEDFVALYSANIKAIALATFLGIGIALLLAGLIASKISKPIGELAVRAKSIAGGNFAVTMEVKGDDEVRDLANAFNAMSSQLKTSYEGLELKVEDKTKEIEEAKKFLENLIEGMEEGVVFMDNDNNIVLANNSAEKLMGKSRAELIGSPILDCHPSEIQWKALTVIEEIQSGKSDFEHSVINVGDKFIENSFVSIKNLQGIHQGIVITSRDITGRINLEERLERSNDELLLLQEINNLLNKGTSQEEIFEIITHGLATVHNYHSSAIYLLNQDEDTLICKSYYIDSKIARKMEELTGLIAKNLKIQLYEGSILHEILTSKKPVITRPKELPEVVKSHTTNKKIKAMASTIARLSKAKWGMGVPLLVGGRTVGLIGIGAREEVTMEDAQKLQAFANQATLAIEKAQRYEILELEVEERAHELVEQEKKYRTLVETMNEGILVIDEKSKVTFLNERMAEILEATQDVIGWDVFYFFGAESKEKFKKELEKWTRGKPTVHESEITGITGKKKPVLISGTPLYDENGGYRGSFGVFTDMTERKILERQIAQSEKLASIGQLAAGVAHEINNPLANISMYTQILLQKARGENKNLLEVIKSQSDVVAKIVRHLLEFSRQDQLNFQTLDINSVISSAMEMVEHQLSLYNIKVNKNLGEVQAIYADDLQLQQVFINVIGNAIQAMPDGGELSVSSFENDGYVIVKVKDTGPGITKKDLEKIFDPFFTTKEVGEGTGLGLSVSHSIIERHNGRIYAESEVGKGTIFYLELPVNQASTTAKSLN